MKLRGLPVELRPGPVDLQVSGAKCALFQPCMHCKLYNRIYLLCQQNHIICVECFLPDSPSNKLTRPQYEGYCKACGTRVTLYRFEIPTPLLKCLKFICGCDYTGRLSDIKEHVKSGEFSVRCSQGVEEPRPSSDEFDVEFAKLQNDLTETVDDFQSQLFSIQEKFKEKFGDTIENAAEPTIYTKRLAENSTLHLGLLNCRLKKIKAELLKLKRSSANITPLVQDNFGKVFKQQPIGSLAEELAEIHEKF